MADYAAVDCVGRRAALDSEAKIRKRELQADARAGFDESSTDPSRSCLSVQESQHRNAGPTIHVPDDNFSPTSHADGRSPDMKATGGQPE